MDKDNRDELFFDPERRAVPFRFDDAVVAVFPDMVRRAIPCYAQLVQLCGLLGRRLIVPG